MNNKIIFHSSIDGDIIEDPQLGFLRILILFIGKDYWSSGSGSVVLEFFSENKQQTSVEIFYVDKDLFYIRYSSEKQRLYCHSLSKEQNNLETYAIYYGGEAMHIPKKLLINRVDCFQLVQEFIELKSLPNNIKWVNDSDLDFDGWLDID